MLLDCQILLLCLLRQIPTNTGEDASRWSTVIPLLSANNNATEKDVVKNKTVFINIEGGKPLHLECNTELKDSLSNFVWLKNGKMLQAHIYGHMLNIDTTTGEDQGIYSCVLGGKLFQQFNVTILEPFFTENLPGRITTRVGSSIELDCDLTKKKDSSADTKVKWFHGISILKTDEKECSDMASCVSVVNGTLSLSNIQAKDSGVYTCSAENMFENFTFSLHTQLAVQVPLELLEHWQPHITRVAGSDVKLSCVVNVLNGYTTEWRKDGKLIVESTNSKITNEKLILRNISSGNSGEYECTVHYYRNAISQSTHLEVKAIPGPLSVKVKQLSPTSVNIEWADPPNTDPAILFYDLYYYNVKGIGKTDIQSTVNKLPFHLNARMNNITLTDLETDRWYEVVMWARNKKGNGVITKVPFYTKRNSSMFSSSFGQDDNDRNSVLQKIHAKSDHITGDHFLLRMLHLAYSKNNVSSANDEIRDSDGSNIVAKPQSGSYSLSQWSVKDKVILGMLCLVTLMISTAGTVGVLAFCTRKPQWQWITRINHSSTYCIQNDLDRSIQPVLNGNAGVEDSSETLLNDSQDADQQAMKMMSVCLSFNNPVFHEDDECVILEDEEACCSINDHGDSSSHSELCGKNLDYLNNLDSRSVNTTASDPQTSREASQSLIKNSSIKKHHVSTLSF